MIVLIMAGGKGTRFWPASTEKKPKQFLKLIDDRTMLQLTVDRMKNITDINKIFIVAGSKYKNLIMSQIKDLPKENFIEEPIGRNTAPCILLSTMYIQKKFPNESMIVCPSDHLIVEENNFIHQIKIAENFTQKNQDAIVTLGIVPNRPETGYGYIKISEHENLSCSDERIIYKVSRFVEKPNLELANSYYNSGKYMWNAGIFIFHISSMINKFKNFEPDTYEIIYSIFNNEIECYKDNLYSNYLKCKSISIDYAIMEKSGDIFVMPSNFTWDDIGSWKSLERYLNKDLNNNIKKGEAVFKNSKNNISFSENSKVMFLNIDNLFCIESNGVIIIGKKDDINIVPSLKGADE